jgi:hypothetical protein
MAGERNNTGNKEREMNEKMVDLKKQSSNERTNKGRKEITEKLGKDGRKDT